MLKAGQNIAEVTDNIFKRYVVTRADKEAVRTRQYFGNGNSKQGYNSSDHKAVIQQGFYNQEGSLYNV